MKRASERDEAIAEVTARLKNYSLSPCFDCGGQGYTDMGKTACFWCRGAGVITQQMAYAFGVADRAEASAPPSPLPGNSKQERRDEPAEETQGLRLAQP